MAKPSFAASSFQYFCRILTLSDELRSDHLQDKCAKCCGSIQITITIVHGSGHDGTSPRWSWRVQVLLFPFPSSSTRHDAKVLLKICRRENLSAAVACAFRPARSSTSKKFLAIIARSNAPASSPPCQSTVSHLFANNQPAKLMMKCSPDLAKPYSTLLHWDASNVQTVLFHHWSWHVPGMIK